MACIGDHRVLLSVMRLVARWPFCCPPRRAPSRPVTYTNVGDVTPGEGPSLTLEESIAVGTAAIEAVGSRVPVLAGVGGPNESSSADRMRRLEAAGVQGFLVVSPYFYPLGRTELIAYFRRLSGWTHLPLMFYNSTYTGTPLTPTIIEELADAIPTFVALKEGNQAQASDVIRRMGGRIGVFSARDLHIHELLAAGGAGAIAFTANIVPELVIGIFDGVLKGRLAAARALQDRLNPLVWEVVARSFPAGIKAAMTLRGLAGGPVRPPLSDFTPEECGRLAEILAMLTELEPVQI